MASRVKKHRRAGTTRLSSKSQITIPAEARRRAGLRPGDELRVDAAGAGRIVLSRPVDPLLAYAGALTGVYEKGSLGKLRREWR
ncbi:MAG: AbrB/MazE/SpoVT family DNA-binding domain-containing protein [Candidatus Limnocylindria bacterium]